MDVCVYVFIHTRMDFCANGQERPQELRASARTYHTHVLIPEHSPCDEWAGRTGSTLAKKGTLTCARRLEGSVLLEKLQDAVVGVTARPPERVLW